MNSVSSFNIIYKSQKEFSELVKTSRAKEFGVYPRYQFKDRQSVSHTAFSQFAKTCSIVLINDEGLHLAPEIREPNLLEKISELAKKIKDKTGELTSFIYGGTSFSTNRDSFNLFNEIGNVLDKEGADISMICGKKVEGSRDALLKDKNNIFITSEGNEELANRVKNNNMTKEQLEDTFAEYYDVVDVSPNCNFTAE